MFEYHGIKENDKARLLDDMRDFDLSELPAEF
jgi:hypothetical protein